MAKLPSAVLPWSAEHSASTRTRAELSIQSWNRLNEHVEVGIDDNSIRRSHRLPSRSRPQPLIIRTHGHGETRNDIRPAILRLARGGFVLQGGNHRGREVLLEHLGEIDP